MMMKSHFCIPPLKPTRSAPKSRRFTQSTLLERFREAVLRLIMLSALNNKASRSGSSSPRSGCQRHASSCSSSQNYYNYARMSTHQSEAVADCIEFIKKKASPEEYDHTFITTTSVIDIASSELEIIRPPVPVM